VWLKVVNKHIADLETDLSDGLRLIALVEVLSGKLFQQKYTRRPTLRPQKLENVTMALRFLERDEGIRIVNIGQSAACLYRYTKPIRSTPPCIPPGSLN